MKPSKNQVIFLNIIEQAIFMAKNDREDNATRKTDKNQSRAETTAGGNTNAPADAPAADAAAGVPPADAAAAPAAAPDDNNDNAGVTHDSATRAVGGKNAVRAAPPILIVCGLFIGFTNGFFGGGGGLICVPVLTRALKLKQKSAHATAILIILPLSLISSLVYLRAGAFQIDAGLSAAAGVIAGGVLGALLLKKLSNKAAGIIFAFIMIAAGVRLIV
jgi:hypothetical protein